MIQSVRQSLTALCGGKAATTRLHILYSLRLCAFAGNLIGHRQSEIAVDFTTASRMVDCEQFGKQ
jgi:hypothetical protein